MPTDPEVMTLGMWLLVLAITAALVALFTLPAMLAGQFFGVKALPVLALTAGLVFTALGVVFVVMR